MYQEQLFTGPAQWVASVPDLPGRSCFFWLPGWVAYRWMLVSLLRLLVVPFGLLVGMVRLYTRATAL